MGEAPERGDERDDRNPKPGTSKNTWADGTSADFDPLRALYDPAACSSTKNARVYDNVAAFESAIKNLRSDKSRSVSAPSGGSGSNTLQRRFEPHQMPVKSEWKMKRRHTRNLFTKMENFTGPLCALWEYMQKTTRVKVYTRNEHRIRGFTTGFVAAFDVHWNIVLSEAEETWTRRKFRFSRNDICFGLPTDCSERLNSLGIKLPNTDVKSLNRKTVECKRRVKEIMIRGEQVVLITPITN